jgi:hypothetical protein
MIQRTAVAGTVSAMPFSRPFRPGFVAPNGEGFTAFGWLFAIVAGLGLFVPPARGISGLLFLAACIFWAAGGIIKALGVVATELRAGREPGELG